jgi:O-antigen/teichoic acid export membrane protein
MSEIVSSSLRNAVKGSALVLFGMMTSILLWFAAKILVVRSTTKEEFGVYSVAVAVVGMLSVFGSLGIQDGVPRYISIFLGQSKRKDADDMSSAAIKLGLTSGLFFFGALFLLSGQIARYVFYKPEIETALRAVAFFVPCSVMTNIIGGIFRGHNVVTPRVFILDIGQPLFFLVMVFIFSSRSFPFISIVYSYAAAMAIVCAIVGIFFFRRLRLNPFTIKAGKYGRELLKFSSPLLVATFLGVVLAWCDTIMLGRYSSASEVGIYNIGMSLAKLLIFPLGAIEFAYMPIAGELYVKRQLGELNKTYQALTKWNFVATLPIFFVLFCFPEMVLTFLFGSRFVDSTITLRILSVCFLFHAFLGANGVLMIVMGRSKDLMLVSIFGTVLDIILNYFLIKILGFGATGAAVATLVSYFSLNIIISLILYRINGTNPLTASYIKPAVGSAVTGLAIYSLAKILPLYYWMLPMYLLLFLLSYTLVLLTTGGFDAEDAALLETMANKIGVNGTFLRRFIR